MYSFSSHLVGFLIPQRGVFPKNAAKLQKIFDIHHFSPQKIYQHVFLQVIYIFTIRVTISIFRKLRLFSTKWRKVVKCFVYTRLFSKLGGCNKREKESGNLQYGSGNFYFIERTSAKNARSTCACKKKAVLLHAFSRGFYAHARKAR